MQATHQGIRQVLPGLAHQAPERFAVLQSHHGV
jgi:hypothetical protein